MYLLYMLILFFFQFCLMIAFASLSGFTLHHSSSNDGRFDFFYFATVVSWLLVIALFLIFALTLTDRLYEKCGNINWNLLVSHPLLSVQLYNHLSKSLVTLCCFWCNLSHNAIHWVFLAMLTLNGTNSGDW